MAANNLQNKHIVAFYEFLCEYEKNIKNEYGSFDFKNQQFQRFCTTNKIDPKNKKSSLPNKFWFTSRQDPKTKVNDVAHHLLRHIRNAFAHGLVRRKGKYIILEDYNRNGNQSMCGKIHESLIWQFIETLKQTKKQ